MTEKRFNVFDIDGTIFLEDHKEGSYHIGEIGNVDVNCLNNIADKLNELHEENQELKQQIKHSQKRTAIISGWLYDEGNLTLDKYEEILDYCYQEYKKGNCE